MHELARNGARVTLAREGKGKLYYTLRLSYVRGELPRSGVERGFAVEREYECIGAADLARGDTKGKACGSVKAGDYVRVVVRVAVPATPLRMNVFMEAPNRGARRRESNRNDGGSGSRAGRPGGAAACDQNERSCRARPPVLAGQSS